MRLSMCSTMLTTMQRIQSMPSTMQTIMLSTQTTPTKSMLTMPPKFQTMAMLSLMSILQL